MNHKLGRIGKQEAFCVGAIAACASAIFTPDSVTLYARGNSAYIVMLLSAAAAVFVFYLVARAMQATQAQSLWELLRLGLGPVLSRVAALFYALLLVLMAATLLSRFTLMLGRFIFPLAMEWQLLLYLLLAACIPAWLGLEGLGRAARLFCWVLLFAVVGAFILAAYNYEPHRLAPYLGDGTQNLIDVSARQVLLFLPAMLGLLIVSEGVHGTANARRAGCYTGVVSGALASLSQLCLGMTYSYRDLSEMHSPMYRLTMGFKTGGYFPRLDTLLVFGWAMASMLASGFYLYAAALLFAQAFSQADIRPSIVIFAGCIGGLTLLLHVQADFLNTILQFLSYYGYIAAAAPVLLAALIAPVMLRRRLVGRGKEELV